MIANAQLNSPSNRNQPPRHSVRADSRIISFLGRYCATADASTRGERYHNTKQGIGFVWEQKLVLLQMTGIAKAYKALYTGLAEERRGA